MDASRFEFSVAVPCDGRFAETVRALAAQAARYAGCAEVDVESFAGAVEDAVRASVRSTPAGEAITVVMRRADGPVEVLVDGRAITVTP